MHRIFCIMGRTCSGKSTMSRIAADFLGLRILKSYTTRSPRNGETEENSDHIFIPPDTVDNYKDIVAITKRANYTSFATKEQLMNSDIYIINPAGYRSLVMNLELKDIIFIPIVIKTPEYFLRKRAKERGDYDEWIKNYNKESYEFNKFENSIYDYITIWNVWNINVATNKLIKTIKERI